MNSWIVFINFSVFILGVIVSSSDGAYNPALKAAERLSRRCEECGEYKCVCPKPSTRSSGKGYSSSGKGYSSSGKGYSSSGKGYSSKSKGYDYGSEDCYDDYEYTGRSTSSHGGSRKKKGPSGEYYCEEYGGGYERSGKGGGYYEKEYETSGSYYGEDECCEPAPRKGHRPPPKGHGKKGGPKKKGGSSCGSC